MLAGQNRSAEAMREYLLAVDVADDTQAVFFRQGRKALGVIEGPDLFVFPGTLLFQILTEIFRAAGISLTVIALKEDLFFVYRENPKEFEAPAGNEPDGDLHFVFYSHRLHL